VSVLLYIYKLSLVLTRCVEVEFYRFFYLHLIDDPPDAFDTPWYPSGRRIDVGTSVSHFLDQHRDVETIPIWPTTCWWFDQRVPGYDLRWSEIDRRVWMALVARHPELFIFSSVPVQRFIWLRWHGTIVSTLYDENP
jgi:hypothetical protein